MSEGWSPVAAGRGRDALQAGGIFGGDENILYLSCDGGFSDVYNCQNS